MGKKKFDQYTDAGVLVNEITRLTDEVAKEKAKKSPSAVLVDLQKLNLDGDKEAVKKVQALTKAIEAQTKAFDAFNPTKEALEARLQKLTDGFKVDKADIVKEVEELSAKVEAINKEVTEAEEALEAKLADVDERFSNSLAEKQRLQKQRIEDLDRQYSADKKTKGRAVIDEITKEQGLKVVSAVEFKDAETILKGQEKAIEGAVKETKSKKDKEFVFEKRAIEQNNSEELGKVTGKLELANEKIEFLSEQIEELKKQLFNQGDQYANIVGKAREGDVKITAVDQKKGN